MDDPISVLIEHTRLKRDLQKQVRAIEKTIDAACAEIIEQFINDGTQSTHRNGMTVYLSKQTTCKAKDGVSYTEIAMGFQTDGIPEVVTVNHQQVKALVREYAEDNRRLPDTISDLMDI